VERCYLYVPKIDWWQNHLTELNDSTLRLLSGRMAAQAVEFAGSHENTANANKLYYSNHQIG